MEMEIGNVKNKSHFFRKKSWKNSLQEMMQPIEQEPVTLYL